MNQKNYTEVIMSAADSSFKTEEPTANHPLVQEIASEFGKPPQRVANDIKAYRKKRR